MSNPAPATPAVAEAPDTKTLADIFLDAAADFNLTAAEIVAALEVAKSIVIMDCVAEMVAATRAEEFVQELIAEGKPTVN